MKIFKRTKTLNNGVSFPDQELEHINNCLDGQFSQLYPISLENKSFQTYGQIFSDEILLIVSLVCNKNTHSPISFFLSKSVDDDEIQEKKLAKKSLDAMIDLVGIFFDEVLSNPEWDNYTLDWIEEDYKNAKYFVKTTRENIELTLQANHLLGADFDEDTFEEEMVISDNSHNLETKH